MRDNIKYILNTIEANMEKIKAKQNFTEEEKQYLYQITEFNITIKPVKYLKLYLMKNNKDLLKR